MLIDKQLLIDLCKQVNDDENITQDQYESLKVTIKSFCDKHPSPQVDLEAIMHWQLLLGKTVHSQLADSWFELFLSTNVKDFSPEDLSFFPVIFCNAIAAKQKNTIKFMIQNQLVDKNSRIDCNGNQITPLMYCLYDKWFDPHIFELVLSISDINYQSNLGTTALYKSIELDDQYAFHRLLTIPTLEIKGHYLSSKLFDEAKNKPHIFKILVEQSNKRLNLVNIKDIVYFPIALLSEDIQNKLMTLLLENIKNVQVFDDVLLRNRFVEFINNPQPLPFKSMNRLSIAVECILTLMYPEYVRQSGNTCGPATLMQHLAIANPELFVHSVLEIAELSQGNSSNSNCNKLSSHLPASIKSLPLEYIDGYKDLWDLWIHTVRNNYNPILGYSQKSKFEMFLGMTSPYDLVTMFEDFGYEIKAESLIIRFALDSRPGLFLENLRQRAQAHINLSSAIKCNRDDYHHELSEDERLEQLRNWCSQFFFQPVVILVNSALVEKMIKADQNPPKILYIEPSHFVNIKYFQMTETKIIFSCLTYGKSFDCQIPIDEFKKGYLGGLFVQVKPKEQQCIQKAALS